MSVVLYHFPPSLCSQKVRLALCEKGVEYSSRLVNIGPPMENYDPAYARLNPRLVVPTLVVDDEPVTDSAHIVREIDRRFDGPDLGAGKAAVRDLIALQDDIKIREIAYSIKRGLIGFLTKGSFDKRLEVLKRRRHENPDLADIYQRRIDDVLAWREVSMSGPAVADLQAAIEDKLDVVEARFSRHEFLAGNRYTMADAVWTVILARLKLMKYARRWPDRRPNLVAYYSRMKQRPSFDAANVLERFKPTVAAPIIASIVLSRLGRR